MARLIRVSKQGLSQCPSCQTHIKIAEDLKETSCPFCGAALLTEQERAAMGSTIKGRGAKMALALFGTAAIVGACMAPPSALYGIPPQENQQEQTQDAGSQDQTVVETVPDAGPVPKYGLPPTP